MIPFMEPRVLPRSLVIRGVVSLIFALVAILLPGPTLLSIALLFGAYLVADGISALVSSNQLRKTGHAWKLVLFEGILGVVGGIAAILWPGLTILVLTGIVAAWALLTGVLEISAGFRSAWARSGVRVFFVLAGILSVALGIVMISRPGIGVLTFLGLMAAYATLFGISFIAMGLQLRRQIREGRERPPSGEIPRHAA